MSDKHLDTNSNESADRLTTLLARQSDQFDALLVALRALVPSPIVTKSRREDAAAITNGQAFFYHLEMTENLDIKSLYIENATGSVLTVYPGRAQAGVPILTVNTGTYRRCPLNVALKEICIVGTGSGAAPNSTPLYAMITTATWSPAIGSIV